MTQPDYSNLYEVVMEQLIQHGPQAFRDVIRLCNPTSVTLI